MENFKIMAEKKIAKKSKLSKLNEEALQEQPAAPIAQPVPATNEEVAQAAEPIAEPSQPAENTELPTMEGQDPMFTPPAEGYVPAGWVKIEDLASAVAQATGDVVPAETAPDTQTVTSEENTAAANPAAVEEQPLVQEPVQPVAESKKSSGKRVKEALIKRAERLTGIREARGDAHEFAFLVSDGAGAASRGGEPDHFSTLKCTARDLKSALLQVLPNMLNYDPEDDFDEGELEGMSGEDLLARYMEGVDLGSGEPWIEAAKQDGKVIHDMGTIAEMIDYDEEFSIDPEDAAFWGIKVSNSEGDLRDEIASIVNSTEDGDHQYAEQAIDIIEDWCYNEDMQADEVDLPEIEDMLDAASDPEEKRIVSMALYGYDINGEDEDEDEDEDDEDLEESMANDSAKKLVKDDEHFANRVPKRAKIAEAVKRPWLTSEQFTDWYDFLDPDDPDIDRVHEIVRIEVPDYENYDTSEVYDMLSDDAKSDLQDLVEGDEAALRRINVEEHQDYLDTQANNEYDEQFSESTKGLSMKDGIEAALKNAKRPLNESEEDVEEPLNEAEEVEDVSEDDIEEEPADDSTSSEEDVDSVEEPADPVALLDDTESDDSILNKVASFLNSIKTDAQNDKQEADAHVSDVEEDINSAADSLEQGSSYLKSLLSDEGDYGIDVSGLDFNDEDTEDSNEDFEDVEEDFDESIDRIPVRLNSNGIKAQEVAKRPTLRARESYTGFLPAGSEHFANEENLVESYAKSAAAKRRAIANFREAMRSKNNSNIPGKFREALRSSSKLDNVVEVNSKSWSANRFQEKVEEKQQLNFKELLANGYLG